MHYTLDLPLFLYPMREMNAAILITVMCTGKSTSARGDMENLPQCSHVIIECEHRSGSTVPFTTMVALTLGSYHLRGVLYQNSHGYQ